jgi:hypothetical protein
VQFVVGGGRKYNQKVERKQAVDFLVSNEFRAAFRILLALCAKTSINKAGNARTTALKRIPIFRHTA